MLSIISSYPEFPYAENVSGADKVKIILAYTFSAKGLIRCFRAVYGGIITDYFFNTADVVKVSVRNKDITASIIGIRRDFHTTV